MTITFVKKRFADGGTCAKCDQAQDLLQRRGLWGRIDRVVVADEGDPGSEGMQLAARHGITLAPFFVVVDERGERAHTSVLRFIQAELASPAEPAAHPDGSTLDEAAVEALAQRFEAEHPALILRWAQERFGAELALAFSGAEDVALVHMAAQSGLPFSVFCLDTGRLHPETLAFIEQVRRHYGIAIEVLMPEALAVEALVRHKGLYSFRDEGHQECCGLRKVAPLRRHLAQRPAWVTGQRRDQSPTRTEVATIAFDEAHPGRSPGGERGATPPFAAGRLLKLNPLARWSLAQVWDYLRGERVPTNPLHERGFISIGCEPCTRAVGPGEHERAGRWWWEEATQRECGLHVAAKG